MEVVILAGGKGTRLLPLTEAMPKPLVPIRGIPIVQILVDYFRACDFRKFLVCIGYKGDSIKQYFNSFNKNLDVTYIDSGEEADILKRIIDCKDFVSDRFMVCYGDAVANVNIPKLVKLHKSFKALVTLTTFRMQSPYGLIISDDSGAVRQFKEKPMLPYWMNIGFMVFERKALKHASEQGWLEFLNRLASLGRLYSHKHKGFHFTFNNEVERQYMEKNFDKFYEIMAKGVYHEN